ncbi:MAG: hypothetical protein LBE12_10830 [Planctomycetaceae bacterium]|jgi:hypothetical protein|nr:hypothetical protein [Planctomycetaceae bacterium]
MTNQYLTFFSFRFFLLLPLLFLGCNNGHVGLSGKVVFSEDGSPLTFGTVCFSTPTFQAKGEIKNTGSFTMGSLGAADGLPPGTYTVYILGATEDLGGDNIYSILDPKWNSPSTSDFTVTVEKTTRNLEIKVDRNPESREQFLNKK